MARSMWRGAIQFGLVTIPVKMYLATEARGGLSFNLLHKGVQQGGALVPCLQRIRMQTHCPEHGDISRADTVRGFEYAREQYVVIEESDLDSVPLATVRAIEIEQFVPAGRGDHATTFVKQAYYLEPEPIGRKAFALLRSVLAETGLQAVCKIALRDREVLAALDPYQRTMLLSTLYWPDEVRDLGELDLPAADVELKPAEVAMARQLVQAMTGEFDPGQYRDEYRDALMKVIEAKIEGQPVEAPRPVAETKGLTDLMAVLEASVASARAARGAEAAPAEVGRDTAAPVAEPVRVAEARKARSKAPATPAPTAARRRRTA